MDCCKYNLLKLKRNFSSDKTNYKYRVIKMIESPIKLIYDLSKHLFSKYQPCDLQYLT